MASAWLVERTRGLTLAIDGKKLAALADIGVPAPVIDVAVALAYPDVFGIASDSREAQRRPGVEAPASQSPNRAGYRGMPMDPFYYDPYFGYLDPWYYYSGYGRRYGYGYPYGYYGYGYGYGSPYGWYGPYGGTYYSGGPTVVVIQNPSARDAAAAWSRGEGARIHERCRGGRAHGAQWRLFHADDFGPREHECRQRFVVVRLQRYNLFARVERRRTNSGSEAIARRPPTLRSMLRNARVNLARAFRHANRAFYAGLVMARLSA